MINYGRVLYHVSEVHEGVVDRDALQSGVTKRRPLGKERNYNYNYEGKNGNRAKKKMLKKNNIVPKDEAADPAKAVDTERNRLVAHFAGKIYIYIYILSLGERGEKRYFLMKGNFIPVIFEFEKCDHFSCHHFHFHLHFFFFFFPIDIYGA
jgi:hypothetical protein